MTCVKICGLCRPADAAAAVQAGATYLGVILSVQGPRALDEGRARAVLAARGGAHAVGVVVDEPVDRTAALAAALALDVIQLHGGEGAAHVRALREATPAALWKAVRVRDAHGARAEVQRWAGLVDGVLLDGWSPAAAGGTGSVFDWAPLADVRSLLPAHAQLIVAGGLHAGNVGRAIEALAPDVVDTSSGVETLPGEKSAERMRAFVAAADAQRKEARYG